MPLFAINDDAYFMVEQKCSTCDGKGHGQLTSYCMHCHAVHTQDELVNAESTQPCGHEWKYMHEVDTCDDCEGTGQVAFRLTLKELATVLKRY